MRSKTAGALQSARIDVPLNSPHLGAWSWSNQKPEKRHLYTSDSARRLNYTQGGGKRQGVPSEGASTLRPETVL